MILPVACTGHAGVDALLFGGPIVGVIAWIKFDSWRRRDEPDSDVERGGDGVAQA